jgi:hypothetical protein
VRRGGGGSGGGLGAARRTKAPVATPETALLTPGHLPPPSPGVLTCHSPPSPSTSLIIVSNVLPVRQRRVDASWEFEWDEDALVAQAKVGGWGGACGRAAGSAGG